MKIASMPNFKKLWGRIEKDIPAGNYTLTIENCTLIFIIDYNMDAFRGEKYFVVSEANFFGGNNTFLAIAYLVVGSVLFLFAIFFFIRKHIGISKAVVPR